MESCLASDSHSPDSPALAGLRCNHEHCDILFSDIEDCEQHAYELHDGVVLAKTCTVREMMDKQGNTKLVLVPDNG